MKRMKFVKNVAAIILAFLLIIAPVSLIKAPAAGLTADQLMAYQDKGISRGEFAMLLNACLSLPEGTGDGFTDVPDDHSYALDIATAQFTGYMSGDGFGNFRPDDIISGAEAASCISFFLGFNLSGIQPYPYTSVPSWAVPAVSNLIDLKMVPLQLTDKKALTVADAITFLTALTNALMFQGSPYALQQVSQNDDFYGYTNRAYLATATIRPGNIWAMAFQDPDYNVQNQIAALLADILSNDQEPGSDAWKINELYGMYMDEPGRANSLKKVKAMVSEIKAVTSIAGLNKLAAECFPAVSLQGFYGMAAINDAKIDATKWCAIVYPGDFFLGSRDYYDDSPMLTPIHEALKRFIASLLAYVGETENLGSRSAAVFEMEKNNALVSMPMEVFNNPDVIYTLSSWEEMDKITAGSNSLQYSPKVREALKNANVYCPDIDYIKHIEALYTEKNLEVLKDFAILNTVMTFGNCMGDDFLGIGSELQTYMYGSAIEPASLALRAQMLVTNLMSGALSKLYANKYVSPATKQDVTQIVGLIKDKYRERIMSVEWMGEETKLAAAEKLDSIKLYVAYPDKYRTKYDFNVKSMADGGNLVDFTMDYTKAILAQQIEDLKKPFEKILWDSVPTYTVNAFYSPTENAVIIPAGILQEPFYSPNASREANIGGIGAVIAHEFTHAFDNNGAKYDKNGTIANWWADEDYAAFNALNDNVIAALFDTVVMGDLTVNGLLCAGETIADLGAMACVLDIASEMDDADLAIVMRSWARIWAARMSPEVTAYLLAIDVHAPNKVRVNFTLSHLDQFYDVFGIIESDGMYVAPENRINIW